MRLKAHAGEAEAQIVSSIRECWGISPTPGPAAAKQQRMMLLAAGLGKKTESSRKKQQLFAGGGAQQRENEDRAWFR